MPFFHDYPYESYHEMNLDWIIGMIKKLTGEMHDFKVVNQITFWGDWDITKQYPAWSVVNNNGDGYISIKPVPAGIDIANTDYWILVANYSALYADMQNRIIALENTMNDIAPIVNNLGIANVKDYGAIGDGNTVDTDAIRAAIADAKANKKAVYFPKGTYLVDATADSGDFLLYLGTVNGLEIFGTEGATIKLADNVGRNRLLFGTGVADTVHRLYIHDLIIFGNGSNNKQDSTSDPLRYNSAMYLYSPCEDVTVENVIFNNFSGHQIVRVGDSQFTQSKNITIRNCEFNTFGTGISGNNIIDVSVIYIVAENALIHDCVFTQPSTHAFNYSLGETAIELHCKNPSCYDNVFKYVKLGILYSSYDYDIDGIVCNNDFINCAIMYSTPDIDHDLKVFIEGNVYRSNKMAVSSIVAIGTPGETNAGNHKRYVTIKNNQFVLNTTNNGVGIIAGDFVYIDELIVSDNIIKYLTAAAVYLANSTKGNIIINNNIFDSVGILSATAYETEVECVKIGSGNGYDSVRITENNYMNTLGKTYINLNVVIGNGDEIIVDNNNYDRNDSLIYINGTFTYRYVESDTIASWNVLGTTTGNTQFDIPANAKMIMAKANTCSVCIPVTGSSDQVNAGWYAAANNFQFISVRTTSNNKVYMNEFIRNGTDETASTTVTLYWQ